MVAARGFDADLWTSWRRLVSFICLLHSHDTTQSADARLDNRSTWSGQHINKRDFDFCFLAWRGVPGALTQLFIDILEHWRLFFLGRLHHSGKESLFSCFLQALLVFPFSTPFYTTLEQCRLARGTCKRHACDTSIRA